MKKYPKITITKMQHEYIKELLPKECISKVIDKTFIFVYGKKITEVKHAYCSAEYNTIQYVVRAIAGGYLNRLNIVEG